VEEEFWVEFLKTISKDNQRRENRIISTRVFATTPKFNPDRIKKEHEIKWNCPITYPLDGCRHALEYLGRAEAKIPHEKLFPHEIGPREVEATFVCTIKPEGQLLQLAFFLKQDDEANPLYPLEKTFLPGAKWSDASEWEWHQASTSASAHKFRYAPEWKPGRRRKPKRKFKFHSVSANGKRPRSSIWDLPLESDTMGDDGENVRLSSTSRGKAADTGLPESREVLHRDIPSKPAPPRGESQGNGVQPQVQIHQSNADDGASNSARHTTMSITSILDATASIRRTSEGTDTPDSAEGEDGTGITLNNKALYI
jgi:hypothetical protein